MASAIDAIPGRRRQAVSQPPTPKQTLDLADALFSAGCVEEAVHYYRRAIAADPENRSAVSRYLFALNHSAEMTATQVAAEHFRLACKWARPERAHEQFNQPADAERQLNVGYLATNLAETAVGSTVQSLAAAHRPDQFRIRVYDDSGPPVPEPGRTGQAGECFKGVAHLSDAQLETLLLHDQTDILVDLTGTRAGRNRLAVLAARVAPVQISMWGHAATTGMNAIDIRISDFYCDPPHRTQGLHSESLVQLPCGLVCYAPPTGLPELTPLPLRGNGYVTFGSFEHPARITEPAFRCWAALLRTLPTSRLSVRHGCHFESEWLCDRWRAILASHDVDPARLTFLLTARSQQDHYGGLASVDIALCPFPYQGCATTLEALSMGVPVITLAGDNHCQRMSSSVLARLGLHSLVTERRDEYVAAAARLAQDLRRMTDLRAHLRPLLLDSSVCDVPNFAAELESVYRNLWRDWCARRARGQQ